MLATGNTPMSERILTLHPEGKQGVNILKSKYDAMRKALLKAVPEDDAGVPFKDLDEQVAKHLGRAFGPEDSVRWYLVAVKQDLEARGELEIVPKRRPQHLRRVR
jgi:hypothetical protein